MRFLKTDGIGNKGISFELFLSSNVSKSILDSKSIK